jgi:hypothetical protein
VILKPNSIAHIDIAAAQRAFPEVLAFAQWAPGDLPTDDGAARARFVQAGDFHPIFRSKNLFPSYTYEAALRTSHT